MAEYSECRKCIYKPCDKREYDVKYCFVRFLIEEAEIEAGNIKRLQNANSSFLEGERWIN